MEYQESFKGFIKNKRSVLLLFGLALIGGSLWAILFENTNKLQWKEIEDYLMKCQQSEKMDFGGVMIIFCTYFKRYLMIWLLGGIAFLLPLAVAMIFLEISVYSFTLTSLYIYYGSAGMMMAGRLFLLQGSIVVVLCLDLANYLFRKNGIFEEGKMNTYGYCLVKGVLGCGGITLIEWLLISL